MRILTLAMSFLLVFSACSAMGGMGDGLLVNSLAEAVVDSAAMHSRPIQGASLTTEYNEKTKNRTTNLVIATKTIDGTILQPGDTFSFNEAIGKTTWAKGYRPAKIFVKGREAEAMGGGICQVSSTLYNAADYGGMEIIERHPHSKKVGYVKEGRDAAVSYGGVDLKFRNGLDYPVKIVAKASGGELTISLEAVV